MAEVVIPNPTWLALLGRLGIQRFGQWALSDRLVPVALVDAGSVTLNVAALSPLFGAPASAGEVSSPAANTRLADTGQLAAGNWSTLVWISHGDTGANHFRFRRRNAADAADIWSQRFVLGVQYITYIVAGRFSVALNERFVVENVNAGGAFPYQVSIFAVRDA